MQSLQLSSLYNNSHIYTALHYCTQNTLYQAAFHTYFLNIVFCPSSKIKLNCHNPNSTKTQSKPQFCFRFDMTLRIFLDLKLFFDSILCKEWIQKFAQFLFIKIFVGLKIILITSLFRHNFYLITKKMYPNSYINFEAHKRSILNCQFVATYH